jgi:hypothetical protein
MSFQLKRVEYFYTSVVDQPGEAYQLLSRLKSIGVNLLAFTAIPVGPTRTQLTLFPEDTAKLQTIAQSAGFKLDGPYSALLVQSDDELGALADIHAKLYQGGVNVYASSGVTDGKGSFGYLLYLKEEDLDKALHSLDL